MYPELSVHFRTVSVMGSTAYDITNHKSTTSAREIYEKRLNRLPSSHKVLVLLGEIDASFLIWSLADKRKLDVVDVFNETIARYEEFLIFVRNTKESSSYVVHPCQPLMMA